MDKTIEELEGVVWGELEDNSRLVRTVHQLRRKAIDTFTIEDLRIMIGQNVGVAILMPRALGILEANPFAKGDMYPGDLLANVFAVADTYWQSHPDQTERAFRVTRTLRERVEQRRRMGVEEAMRLYGATIDGHESEEDRLLQLSEQFVSRLRAD